MQKRMTTASFDLTPGAGSPFFDDLRQDKEIRGDKIFIIRLYLSTCNCWLVALSKSIFSLYKLKQKQKKIGGFNNIFFVNFQNITKIEKNSETNFKTLSIHKPSL